MSRRAAPAMPTANQVKHASELAAEAMLTMNRNGLHPSAVAIGPEGVRFEFTSATARNDGYQGKGLDEWRANSERRAS